MVRAVLALEQRPIAVDVVGLAQAVASLDGGLEIGSPGLVKE